MEKEDVMFALSVHHGPPFLLLTATGRGELANLRGACRLLAEIGAMKPNSRVLIDLLGVTPYLGPSEREALGLFAARELRVFSRIAVLTPQVSKRALGTNVAKRAGLNLQLFEDLKVAESWIMQ